MPACTCTTIKHIAYRRAANSGKMRKVTGFGEIDWSVQNTDMHDIIADVLIYRAFY